MYSASGEARNATTPATSPGVPTRDRGICSTILFRTSSEIEAVMSVVMNPGAIALTQMFRGPSSRASDFVNPMIPDLEAE